MPRIKYHLFMLNYILSCRRSDTLIRALSKRLGGKRKGACENARKESKESTRLQKKKEKKKNEKEEEKREKTAAFESHR